MTTCVLQYLLTVVCFVFPLCLVCISWGSFPPPSGFETSPKAMFEELVVSNADSIRAKALFADQELLEAEGKRVVRETWNLDEVVSSVVNSIVTNVGKEIDDCKFANRPQLEKDFIAAVDDDEKQLERAYAERKIARVEVGWWSSWFSGSRSANGPLTPEQR